MPRSRVVSPYRQQLPRTAVLLTERTRRLSTNRRGFLRRDHAVGGDSAELEQTLDDAPHDVVRGARARGDADGDPPRRQPSLPGGQASAVRVSIMDFPRRDEPA